MDVLLTPVCAGSCAASIGTALFPAALARLSTTYQSDKCLDTANEMYIMCQKLQES